MVKPFLIALFSFYFNLLKLLSFSLSFYTFISYNQFSEYNVLKGYIDYMKEQDEQEPGFTPEDVNAEDEWIKISLASAEYSVKQSKLSRLVALGRLASKKDTRDERVTLVSRSQLSAMFPPR